MSKTRGVHGQYDTNGQCGTRPGPSRPKVGAGGPTPLAEKEGTGVFFKTVFSMCQSKLVSGVSNVGIAVERLNVAVRPSFMAGWPDKWVSRAHSSTRAPPYSSYKYPGTPPG
jgi:hypothetical protein